MSPESLPLKSVPMVSPAEATLAAPTAAPTWEAARQAISATKVDQLASSLESLPQCIVAFSGGVDSVVAAQAAVLALGAERVRVVMALGPAVATGEYESALLSARAIGLELETIDAGESSDPDYLRNDSRRCFHCKSNLYQALETLAQQSPQVAVINGVNADDLGDYRPGLEAAAQHGVRAVLAEAGITKAEVRALALAWGLAVHDKPAMPCLASRVAYGVPVTVERLARIDAAERLLRELGFRECRVRCHEGELARIEIAAYELNRWGDEGLRSQVLAALKRFGFRFVTLDLEGFRSGNLNALIQIERKG